MHFSFDIHLTDEDYLALNEFVTLKSSYGKKRLRRTRLIIGVILGVLIVANFLSGNSLKSKIIMSAVQTVLLAGYLLLLPRLMKSSIKWSLKSMKKSGKLAYSPEARMEFYDDHFAEITEDSKSEMQYTALERASVLKDHYVYLHIDRLRAFVIPWSSFASEDECNRFIGFISGKCAVVDQYLCP